MNNDNFTQKIKLEILKHKKNKVEALEFVKGFLHAKIIITNNDKYFLMRKSPILNQVLETFKQAGVKLMKKGSKYFIDNDLDFKSTFISPSHFFGGAFVAGGIVNNLSKSSYYLHLSAKHEEFVDVFLNKLNNYDFNFKKIKHQNLFKIYVKKHEKVADFFKAILVTNILFEFEDHIIERDYINSINRINNIDISNDKKVLLANRLTLEKIKFIEENNLTKYFKSNALAFFEILKKYPEENLTNLAVILANEKQINVTKSGLNHWRIKLKNIITKHQKNQE
ncbi:DNA-binding protein WhiA [Mycoplasmopsis opalescens]|uniref:DNA-binding protein WhiA n=1 Tax=Mycoplasmopsis opalescens TaxID=114886 RepID=UPI0004A6A991|nr:DNA-binding protein WhiA [Mycoplasmopsis opalescens]